MNKQQPLPTDAEREAFEAWWEREGQFCRAGGGDYEKTFAFRAWQAARRTPAPVGVEPIGHLYCGGCDIWAELADWEIVADHRQCDKLNEHYGALGKEAKLPIYTTPQPTQAQAGAVPLTRQQLREAFYIDTACTLGGDADFAEKVCRVVEKAHGIKQGGQRGTE